MRTIEVAYDLVKRRLDEGEWQPGQRMPPLADLANACGVCRTTMWRALGRLQKETLVHANQRGAIIAGAAGVYRSRPSSRELLWNKLKSRMGQEIMTGRFARDFPATSKLAIRYGVGEPTMRKVIESLVDDRLLVRQGRRYRPAPNLHFHQRSIVLISYGDKERGLVSWGDPRTQALVEGFERESQIAGFEGRCEPFDDRTTRCLVEMATVIKEAANLQGCIVNLWKPWGETQQRRWLDLIAYLTGRRIPVVVIDQASNTSLPDLLQKTENLRMLRIAGARAGEMMANTLLRRGYRRLAFVTPAIDVHWVQSRYAGLCNYFRKYGGSGAAVETFDFADYYDIDALRHAILNLDDKGLSLLYRGRLTNEEVKSFISTLKRARKQNLPALFANDVAAQTLRKIAGFMVKLSGEIHDDGVSSVILDWVLHLAGESAHQEYLRPFFQKILKSSSATAWVCGDEKTARAALTFLRKSGKKVPEQIAVAGFENWREEYERQLTTYDFNMNGIVQQAILMLLDEKFRKSKPLISEVDGYVVERRTTRR